jgi:hypothetical protein
MSIKTAHVARTSEGFQHVNTLNLKPEVRQILLAEGLDFHDDQKHPTLRIPDCLIDPSQHPTLAGREPLAVETDGPNHFEFLSKKQGVRFVVDRAVNRDHFKESLQDPKLHVIYTGHARLGRGPCFGRGLQKHPTGELWEDGTSPDNGIYRMGFPFIAVSVAEIEEHGYTANLVASDIALKAPDCDPDLRRHLGVLKRKTADEIADEAWALRKKFEGSEVARFDLRSRVRDSDPNQQWWAFRGFEHGKPATFVVLHAGWEETTTAPLDLGLTDVRCRVFFHCGCSTLQLNREIYRNRKIVKQEGDRGYAYFTTAPSWMSDALFYLYHLFTYPKYNRFQKWGPSLDYAVQKANADLLLEGAMSRIK